MDIVYAFGAAVAAFVCYFLSLAALCTEEEIGYNLRLTGVILGGLFGIYFIVSLVGLIVLSITNPELLPH